MKRSSLMGMGVAALLAGSLGRELDRSFRDAARAGGSGRKNQPTRPTSKRKQIKLRRKQRHRA